MLAALFPLFAIASVQDRVVSVDELISSFDTAETRHAVADELGKTIVYLHAPGASSDAIKEKLADVLSAGWKRTDSGFKLERSSKQLSDLKNNEVNARAEVIRGHQEVLRKKLTEADTVEKRMSAALQSFRRMSEKYSNPGNFNSFRLETEMPADWVLFSAIALADARELADLDYQAVLELSDKPVGAQRAISKQLINALAEYERDKVDLVDFAKHILSETEGSPIRRTIELQISRAVQPARLSKAIFAFARSDNSIGCGLYLYDENGKLYDQAILQIPTHTDRTLRLAVPAALTGEYSERQTTFTRSSMGDIFIRSPEPEVLRAAIGLDPLVGTEPMLNALANNARKPFLGVLDDRLASYIEGLGGSIKSVARFVQKAEDHGLLDQMVDRDWMVLRPRYLLDSEAGRLDRKALKEFLTKTSDAGCVKIEDYLQIVASSGEWPLNDCLQSVFGFLNWGGYVLVSQYSYKEDLSCRIVSEALRQRGSRLEQPIEIPVSSLSAKGKDLILKWARRKDSISKWNSFGEACLESQVGFTHSDLQKNANEAMPGGIPSGAVLKLTPFTDEFIGLQDNWPTAFSAKSIAFMSSSNNITPEKCLTRNFHFGRRRGIKLEIVVRQGLLLQDSYVEAANTLIPMASFSELPENFRSEVQREYEEALKRKRQ